MPWAILTDQFHLDEDVSALSDSAHRLYVNGLTTVQLVRSFGIITPIMLRQMAPPSWDSKPGIVTECVTELVTVGLWEEHEAGWIIRNWETYNSKDKTENKRDETAADRMKRYRQRKKDEAERKQARKEARSNVTRNVTEDETRNVTPRARCSAGAAPSPTHSPTTTNEPPTPFVTGESTSEKPPARDTKGGNSSPPLSEPAAPEASPGDATPMVMLVHGMERKRGDGIPDPATATDDELLAYARRRRAQVQLDDPGGDAA